MKLYFYGIFLQGRFKSTVTLLSPVKNLGFLVRSFPSGCGKILLSPQRVVCLGDTGHSQGTRAPGHSQGLQMAVIFWETQVRFSFPHEMMIVPSKLYQRLGQCTKKRWYRCWYLHGKPPTNFGRRNSEVFPNPNQQILFSCVFQLSVNHLGLSENRVYSQWNSNLIGIMISKTIGFRGTRHFQTHPFVRTEPFWSFPSTSPVLSVILAAAASVLIFVAPRPHPKRRLRRRLRRRAVGNRGDASASRPSSDQGLGSLVGAFFLIFPEVNHGKQSPLSPEFP